jgi:hypothetical protein
MNALTIITTVLGLVIGAVGAWAGLRGIRHSKSAPFDERHATVCAQLKQRVLAQSRLAHAVKVLDKHMPSSLVNQDLAELRRYLRGHKHEFRAPTPAQIDAVVRSIDDALDALEVAQHAPKNDTAFLDHVDEIKRKMLRPSIEAAMNYINMLLQGLVEMERKPLSVRKQVKLFKDLEA